MQKLRPGLYIVSTPIGNLADITFRAIDVLKMSDIILCEDTRISNKLLQKYEIHKKLYTYNDHSSIEKRKLIESLIKNGKIISIISDSGTPLISDPGYKLIQDLRSSDLHIEVIPGPCSVISALVISSLPTDKFLFNGFVPKSYSQKRIFFSNLVGVKATLIFFETANRLVNTLKVAIEIFGENTIGVVTRELTKLYQNVRKSSLIELYNHYENEKPKGEIILLIAGSSEAISSENYTKFGKLVEKEDLESIIIALLKEKKTIKEIKAFISKKYELESSSSSVYKMILKLKIDGGL